MKRNLLGLVAIGFVAVLVTSCGSKAPKEARYIPKTASAVFVLDPGSMKDKLQKGGISVDTLLGRIFKNDSADKADRNQLEAFRNNAGINWDNRFYFFFNPGTKLAELGGMSINMLANLSDAGKFEAWLKNDKEAKKHEVKKEKEYSYITPEPGTLISWTDKNILLTVYNAPAVKPYFDTITMNYVVPEKTFNKDSAVKAEVAGYYTQKEDASLASVKAFSEMFKDKADGYFFSSTSSIVPALKMMPLQLPKLEELLKDNYSTATLTFENGKIVVHSASHTNNMITSLLKQYPGKAADLSLIEHYPSQHVNGFMVMAFNPEIFGGLFKQLEAESLINNLIAQTGFTLDNFYHSFKGDMAIVVSDLGTSAPEPQQRRDEKALVPKKSIGKMLLNITVGNKTDFFKIMDKTVELGYLKKEGNAYKAGDLLASLGFYVYGDEKNFILSSDSVLYAQYMAKTSKAALNADVISQAKGKTTVMYFDIANTIGAYSDETAGTGFNSAMQKTKATFKDLIILSDNFNGKSVNSTMEVRMQDSKQNSLVTLTSLLTDIAVDMRVAARREKEVEDKMFPGGVPAIIRTN